MSPVVRPQNRAAWIKKLSVYCGEKHSQYGTHRSKETKEKLSKAGKGRPAWNKGKKCPEISGANNGMYGKIGNLSPNYGGKNHSYERNLKAIETMIGGIWYGNVRYPVRAKYCNVWAQLRNDGRIGACWGFKSVLSGETKDLVYHHVYFQKKACCQWDEDHEGYFAMINIGSTRKQKMYKYYIPGDPNKFVPLTRAENSMVNFNQLKWIKVFEDIIERNGGKCYLTKPEMEEYLKENPQYSATKNKVEMVDK